MRTAAIIPARYSSERLPGKPLLRLKDHSLIQWVYLRTVKAGNLDEVVVATDDERIADEISVIGGRAIMTSPDHTNGTERIAEAAEKISCDLIINVQGDEPFIEPHVIESLAEFMKANRDEVMATAAVHFPKRFSPEDPDKVKVVPNNRGYALYFSRSPVPYIRDERHGSIHYLHLGIYAYRRDFLFRFINLPEGRLEKTEKLEQLRALENGYRIKVLFTDYEGFGIDNYDDYLQALKIIEEKGIRLD